MGVRVREVARVAGLSVFLACLPPPLLAGAGFELAAPDRGWRGPRDPIRIRVAPDVPVEVLRRLALEVDGIDVTRFLRREGEYAVFTPVEPLAYGDHEVRIVEYLPDGSIAERAVWRVEVRQSRAFREMRGSVGASLDATRRVGASDDLDDGPVMAGQGGLNLVAGVADGEWRATGRFGLGYDSSGSGSPGGRPVDLQSYEFRHEWRMLGLTVGQPRGFDTSLLGGDVLNRGIGVGIGERTRSRVRFKAFGARGEPVTGFRRGLGVSEPRNRVSGAQLTVFPLAERPERLVVGARTYAGETPTGGEGVLGSPDGERGRGHAVSLDSSLRDGRLRLHAELARTSWDPDGRGAVLGTFTDEAYVLGMQWRFQTGASGRTPSDWALTLSHGETGPYFRSLLDPAGEADQRATRLELAMQRGALGAALTLERVRNNVDDLPDLATSRRDGAALQVGYQFVEPVLKVLTGLSGGAEWARVRPISVPAGVSPSTLTDDRARSLGVRADYALRGVTGSLTVGAGDYTSYNDAVPDTRSWSWALDAGRGFLNDRLSTRLQVGREFTRERASGATTVSDQASVGVGLTGLARGRLGASLEATLNRTQSPPDTTTGTDASDDLTRSLSGGLSWRLVQGSQDSGRPEVTVGLTGMWQKTERRRGGDDSRDWYVGATLQIQAARALWRPPGGRANER